MSNYIIRKDSYLAHYGVQGMRWGVRNYQNADGSLTAAGRNHYGMNNVRRHGNVIIGPRYGKIGTKRIVEQNSLASGKLIHDQRSRMLKQMKSDFRSARKSGEMSKSDYKNNMKYAKSNVDRILSKEFGRENMKSANTFRAVKIGTTAAAIALTTLSSLSLLGQGVSALASSPSFRQGLVNGFNAGYNAGYNFTSKLRR